MPVDLYYLGGSAPCRAVYMVGKELGVDINIKPTNLQTGDHLKPEFLAMNPEHVVPTLNDNGFILWESRAILSYFANKYGKDDKLYPKDPKARAMVDQRLYFDMGTLYKSFADYLYPQLFEQPPKAADPAKLKVFETALGYLEGILGKSKYVAGDHLTIADISIAASVRTFEVVNIVDFAQYKKINEWHERVKKEISSYNEVNEAGAKEFAELCKALVPKK